MRSMMSTEDDERRGIPPDLLQMWEEEEAAVKAKHGEPVAPEPKDRLFNDLLWDHQWYMVSLQLAASTACTESSESPNRVSGRIFGPKLGRIFGRNCFGRHFGFRLPNL